MVVMATFPADREETDMPLHAATEDTFWRHPGYEGQDPFVFEVQAADPEDDDPTCEGEEDEDASTCVAPYFYATVKNDLSLMYCSAHVVPDEAVRITREQFDASGEW